VIDVLVIGAGPAGVLAALRAADLGARTTLVTRQEFGGLAAYDGPVPVQTLTHAARSIREARRLSQYGIMVAQPSLNYSWLLARVRKVVRDVREYTSLREDIDSAGVTVYEQSGTASFVDTHTIETDSGLRLHAEKVIVCAGSVCRRPPVPGSELLLTPHEVWQLEELPASIMVVGAGPAGVQVASVFNAFGSRVQLFQPDTGILPEEDEEVSATVAAAFHEAGIEVHENFGEIHSFEKTGDGLRMIYSAGGATLGAEAALAVVAAGCAGSTTGLNLDRVRVETDSEGFIRVDEYLQTTAPSVFAAGDITGRPMLVPQAIQDAFTAATNAVRGPILPASGEVTPIVSFTEPEYARIGLTELQARAAHDIVTSVVHFDSNSRAIIDGHTSGFCKLIVDRSTHAVVGCHVVGQCAVETIQAAAIAMAARMPVNALAQVPLSFPTYAEILGRAATVASRQLELELQLGGVTANR
jgi:pyruvate/2-oxoglutarate dehydrogenase complex dihydrolipoamide dehydrogenase (E3) component